jgi:hypothetical protein
VVKILQMTRESLHTFQSMDSVLGNAAKHIPLPQIERERSPLFLAVFRIHRLHMFLGLSDPDPLVRGMDPDPDPVLSIIKQK